MELMEKQGFKQTEVGLIPEDWKVFVLSDVLKGIADVNHYMPKTEKNGIPYVMTGDLKAQVGDIDFDNCKKIHLRDYKELSKKVKNLKGDIILARYATIGTVSFVNIDFDFIVSYSCVTIKPDTSKLLGLFLLYYFKSNVFKLEVYNKVNANIQDNVGIGDLNKMQIPLPPTLTEQKAIATALVDVDELISSLEQLITKKKAIKQGTMQALLTGNTRLKGFEGSGQFKQTEVGLIPEDWRLVPFDEIFTFYPTSNYSKAEMSEDDEVGCLHYGLIHAITNTQYNLNEGIRYYVTSEQAKYALVRDGDVIMVDASEDLEGVNKSVEVFGIGNKKYISGLHTYLLRDKKESLADNFRGIILNSSAVKNQMLQLAVGMKVFGVSKTQLVKVKLLLPTFTEQKAIAQILSDMDSEIKQLETKKEKYQAIKQGMMQELLTGKNRLV
jgi:type I restriction enzyme S subunit